MLSCEMMRPRRMLGLVMATPVILAILGLGLTAMALWPILAITYPVWQTEGR